MTGGEPDPTRAAGLPPPRSGESPREPARRPARPPIAESPTAADRRAAASRPLFEPELPPAPPKRPDPMAGDRTSAGASGGWYRSDQERYRSVHRRANPWYRRLARGLVAACLLVVIGGALYFGARAVQGYVDRDRLPAPGVELPDYRATTFQISSDGATAPQIDGTLTLDVVSGAYEFVGDPSSAQGGVQIVSLDGGAALIRRDGGSWSAPVPGDTIVGEIQRALPYLRGVDSTDDVLPKRLRQGFVTLVDRAEEGEGDNRLTRFEMTFDTTSFSENHPFEWQSYERGAIPGVIAVPELDVTIWTDSDAVVVRLRDASTGWSWERLTYVDEPFVPNDPTRG